MYGFDEKETFMLGTNDDYLSSCRDFAQKHIAPELRDKFLWTMNIRSAIMELDTSSGTYHTSFWTNFNGQRRRKAWRFSYVNNEKTSVLVARSDITESYVDENAYTEKISAITHELELLNYDVTGVLNRRATIYEIRSQIESRMSGSYTIIMIDLDNLKYINDHFGHPAGDIAIKKIAEILQNHFRRNDIIGRIGGDEFMVFCDGEMNSIEEKVNHIIEKVNQVIIDVEEDHHLGCSIGYFSTSYGKHSFEEAYAKVDATLYQAKKGGKNRACAYKE